MRSIKITDEALAVLSACTVSGGKMADESKVTLPEGQLDRKLYVEVNKVLEDIGGKWNRGQKAHVFFQTEEETQNRLEGVILSGEITPLSKNGYFPTPDVLADLVVYIAGIRPGQRICEPSAGSGALVDAMLRKLDEGNGHVRIDTTIRAIEVNPQLAGPLEIKYQNQAVVFVTPIDFMEWTVESSGYLYDRIVANPPFEKRADAKHILHAYSLLKPGGRLVSIMSAGVKFRQEKEYEAVRQLAKEIISLPEGSFKTSGTMVNTVIVVIDKSEA